MHMMPRGPTQDPCQRVPRRLERFVLCVLAMRHPSPMNLMKTATVLILALAITACEAGGSADFPCNGDEDCVDGLDGQCVEVTRDLFSGFECVYDECARDAHCAEGNVCASIDEDPTQPQGTLFCLRATCEPGSDCPDGETCALRRFPVSGGIFGPFPDEYRYTCGDDICGADAPRSEYRITALQIPTMADVAGGSALGHNVDGVGDSCGVVDFAGGIDNAFMTLSAGLLELGSTSPLDLQAELDAALACATPSSTCEPLALWLVLQQCDSVTVVSIRDDEGTTITSHVAVILSGGTELRVQFPAVPLRVPIRTPTGVTPLELDMQFVIVAGTLTATGFDDLVMGGVVPTGDLLSAFTPVLTALDGGPSMEDVEGVLSGLSDVRLGEECLAHSVGLRAVADLQVALP